MPFNLLVFVLQKYVAMYLVDLYRLNKTGKNVMSKWQQKYRIVTNITPAKGTTEEEHEHAYASSSSYESSFINDDPPNCGKHHSSAADSEWKSLLREILQFYHLHGITRYFLWDGRWNAQ